MSQARLAAGLLASLLAMGSVACGSSDTGPARFVVVTIDTLRADRVGAYGHDAAETPTLDGLAERGVRFTHAISPAPLTLPSHASLMTGTAPPEHGAHHNGYFRLDEALPTLAGRMAEGGYATAGFVSAFVLAKRFGIQRGFETFDDRLDMSDRRGIHVAERRGDRTVDAAVAWLEDAPERFFLWVHLYDPHAPQNPPVPFAGRFRHDLYDGEIAFADAQVGRLLEAVAARWPDERTVVVVTSDHGESLGEHGERTHSYFVYDATQHVPLLMAGPGLPAGQVEDGVVRLGDVAPTLLELAGLEPFANVSGRSVLGMLDGSDPDPRHAYLQTLAPRFDMKWSPLYGIRSDTHKYIRAPKPELYEIRSDPGEMRNLATALPERVRELDTILEERLAGARDATPNLQLDASEIERLRALGYVADNDRDRTARLGEVGGPNPRDEIEEVERMNQLNALVAQGEAEAVLEQLAPMGDSPWMTTLRAIAALKARRYDVAKEAGTALIEQYPSQGDGYAFLGRAYEGAGELEKAAQTYEAGIEVNPQFGASLTGLGRVTERLGRTEEAEGWYRRATEATAPDLEGLWRLAALRLADGDVSSAQGLLLKVPATVLSEEEVAVRLGRAELAAGRLDMALLRIRTGLRKTPDSITLHQLEGQALEEQGDLKGALDARRRALLVDPNNPALQNDLAWSLVLSGQRPRHAVQLARSAAAELGDLATVQGTLAAALLAAGQPEEALRTVEAALPRASDDEVRTHLLLVRAEASAQLGRGDEARSSFEQALAGRTDDQLPPTLGRLARRVRADL